MKLRVQPVAARERLAAEIQALGVRAFVTGDTLELSYPGADFVSREHERTELRFFVRAWAATDPSITAEVIA